MNIEIDDTLEPLLLRVSKVHKVTTNKVVESAVIFTFKITRLSDEKQATIQQWIKEDNLKRSAN